MDRAVGLQMMPSKRAYRGPFRAQYERVNTVRIVAEIVELPRHGKLREIPSLSKRRIGDTEICLTHSGINRSKDIFLSPRYHRL